LVVLYEAYHDARSLEHKVPQWIFLTLYLLSENVMNKTYRNAVHVLRYVPFWVIMQRVVIIPYRRFGTTGPETSVRNYHHSLSNNPEEFSSHLPRGGSLKTRIVHVFIRTAWD